MYILFQNCILYKFAFIKFRKSFTLTKDMNQNIFWKIIQNENLEQFNNIQLLRI